MLERCLQHNTLNKIPQPNSFDPGCAVYWRVEGSLVNLRVLHPVGFFIWWSQSFAQKWVRRLILLLMVLLRPFLYATNRIFATRAVHAVLRRVSRDRLDLLGQEFFEDKLKPNLKPQGVAKLQELLATGAEVVLLAQGLDHVIRPLAQHLGVKWVLANRLEFRDGLATGRLEHPVIRPRGMFAWLLREGPDGRLSPQQLIRDIGSAARASVMRRSVRPTVRELPVLRRPIVHFEGARQAAPLSVRKALAGRHVLLIGFTGFIGKVWLANVLMDLPEIGKVYLLIRRQKSNPAEKRFRKVVEESAVFDPLYEKYGEKLWPLLAEKVEVVEGDISQPRLGLDAELEARLLAKLDVVINSSGLTDFNPDLRDALSINVDGTANVMEFVRRSAHGALLHLSTCYVAGQRDGRVSEKIKPNYTPAGVADYDAEREYASLHETVAAAEEMVEGEAVTAELTQQALGKRASSSHMDAAALENQLRKGRIRWLKQYLTEAGAIRARELGWPNTYTLTKSLAESLLIKMGAGLPIAIVRPAIVETSVEKPFSGWNEGINTSAGLSYLLGTTFRQLPSNERKRLDLIPVDSVCQGMTLIAAALVERRHEPMYQLATSVTNPCDMRRCIELTGLAHRRHYREQEGPERWFKLHLDAIPVSKERYQRMSAPAQKAAVRAVAWLSYPVPFWRSSLAKTERGLERVEKMIELFEPFILYNEHDFVADNVEKLSLALVEDERATFGYATAAIDWWDYWINVHIPALRKWTYPLIEGRPLEPRPPRSVHGGTGSVNGSVNSGANSGANSAAGSSANRATKPTETTWQYS